nr:hypothetical protein [uncultured bacterium]
MTGGRAGYLSGVRTIDERKTSDDDVRDETEAERLDRNYGELLQELRVTQTGVQILFAFLLTLAFTQRFEQITSFQRATYVVTLLFAVGAAALFIAPVALHRVVFRQNLKDRLVFTTNRMALAGLVFLLVALVGALLLILDVTLGRTPALWFSALAAAWFLLLWLVVPLASRARD